MAARSSAVARLAASAAAEGLDNAPQLHQVIETPVPGLGRIVAPAEYFGIQLAPFRARANDSAATRPSVQQALAGKHVQRLPQHGAADIVAVKQHLLVRQHVARLQSAAHDVATELLDQLLAQVSFEGPQGY